MSDRHIIDLRSDTVTRPTEEMRQAMAAAEVGDDVYMEDPTVNRLEELAAGLFEKQAALFVPSGTMGNQIAIRVHTQPGQEVLTEERGHIYNYELAAMAALSGVLPRTLFGENGFLTWPQIREALPPKVYYRAQPALVSLENTHNMAGGTVYPPETLDAVCDGAHAAGLRVHLDGARIFNAAVALGLPVSALTRKCDSVMFCLSKGLCAPVGSMLVGSRRDIERARIYRKMYGGGMRQAGILAAAGILALEKMPGRLAEDHANARLLADLLRDVAGLKVEPREIQTNILMIETTATGIAAPELSRLLHGRDIWISAMDDRHLRAVTHRDVTHEDILKAGSAFREIVPAVSTRAGSAGPR